MTGRRLTDRGPRKYDRRHYGTSRRGWLADRRKVFSPNVGLGFIQQPDKWLKTDQRTGEKDRRGIAHY